MFDRIERTCAAIGIHLSANLTALQRNLVLGLGTLTVLFFGSRFLGPGVTIVGVLVLLMVGNRVAPHAGPAAAGPAVTTGAPPARFRPAPRVDLAFDAYMRPVNELLGSVPRPERAATFVALLDVLELFAYPTAPVMVGPAEIARCVAAGDLPRMTSATVDIFADRPAIVAERRFESPQGLHLSVLVLRPGKTRIRLAWTVQMSGAMCAYRLDAADFPRA